MSAHPVPLVASDLDPDPLVQFRRWYDAAIAALGDDANAMALATVGGDGAPSARMVLLKECDADGFRFFTNYGSRKGRELDGNPRAALLFHWAPLARQVRIEGDVRRLDAAASDAYFDSRPLASRLSAIASPQSEVIADRDVLEARVRELTATARGARPPRPVAWGGFVLSPRAIEFWQAGRHRLHDRFRYRREHERWIVERLAP